MGKGFKPTFAQMGAYMDTIKRVDMHFSYLLCADCMMFDYTGLPDTIDQIYLEQYLNISGVAAIGHPFNAGGLPSSFLYADGLPSSLLYAAPFASRCGNLNQYGLGRDCTAFTPNGENIRGEIGKDVAIIYNNSSHTPQTDLFFDAQSFAETDKSVNCNLLFARLAPMFSAGDDKTIDAIKSAIENLIAGNLEIVLDENTIDMMGMGKTENIHVLDTFQHPERVQYLQYLSQYFDVLMRRHFSRRGLSIKTPTKAAQQSTDEIHGMDSVTWFYAINKLNERKKGIEMVNRIFGTNIAVKFSPIWEQEYKAYQLRLLKDDADNENNIERVKENAAVDDTTNADSTAAANTDTETRV